MVIFCKLLFSIMSWKLSRQTKRCYITYILLLNWSHSKTNYSHNKIGHTVSLYPLIIWQEVRAFAWFTFKIGEVKMGEGNYFDHKNGTGSPKPDLKNGTGPPKSVLAKLDRCVITMQSFTHTHTHTHTHIHTHKNQTSTASGKMPTLKFCLSRKWDNHLP